MNLPTGMTKQEMKLGLRRALTAARLISGHPSRNIRAILRSLDDIEGRVRLVRRRAEALLELEKGE